MEALLDLPNDVAPFNRVVDTGSFALVVGASHFAEREDDGTFGDEVSLDEGGVLGPIPVAPRADEVDQRDLKCVGLAQPPVEVVVGRAVFLTVEDPVRCFLILVAPLGERAVD
jgi:hypothetical protein